ncbi:MULTISPECIES: electron transfer flavoprotein subunit beta/FixA family protein [Arthrobacter]|uniref:Electron transfer flavoprotein subunit beta n=1 Tax=Arthrobacter psychrochitiniphilus TaxID=291045 RepID=A0A2V3DV34_9MICC|nr:MULTISPECIES: electron transfer flavoprotein subunit beta/FixA family protein [Arthrobacter]NYG16672.1 electron transfer flavoprotein beta subunit [Arthrobacter psychrochitiniphilus]PXA69218.1 electron transfer flavoprotein subunit beta [Arthrobacter psychrochitiniphilus]
MKIAVLVKQVPDTGEQRNLDPVQGSLDRSGENLLDEINERALEVGLKYKDANKGTEVVVISMGPDTLTKGLRKALSMGADYALHVCDASLAGADAGRTAEVLAAALRHTGADLVLAGNESTDGRGGVVPAMIAERLSLPLMSAVDTVEISGQEVIGERGTETGSVRLSAPFPVMVSVTERCGEARFPSFKGIITAKRKPLSVLGLAELGLADLGSLPSTGTAASSIVISTVRTPARTAGRIVVDEGNAGTELAAFLRSSRLI